MSGFELEDFMDVFDFNTQAASSVLGTAVSEAWGAGSKRAVVRYMKEHRKDADAAEWLSGEYSGGAGRASFVVRAGSPESMELPWVEVTRPREEADWVRIENAREPIISCTGFEVVLHLDKVLRFIHRLWCTD